MAEKKLDDSRLTPAAEFVDGEFGSGKGVCKILDGKYSGTGFLGQFVLNGEVLRGLFTNNHVLGENFLTSSAKFTLEFHLYDPIATEESPPTIVRIKVDSKLREGLMFTCPVLDATFIEFNNEMIGLIEKKVALTKVEYLPLIKREEYERIKSNPNPNPKLQVIGHPSEEQCDGNKHFAFGESFEFRGYNILHKASTTPGSSGSPLFIEDGSVIGIHKAAGVGDYNIAVSVVHVCNAIEKSLEPKNKHLPQRTWYQKLKTLGFKLKHTHDKGNVYSIVKNNKQIWSTYTCHGWHYTLSDPIEMESYTSDTDLEPEEMKKYHNHMFDLLPWKPLAESKGGDDSKICNELAAELESHLKLE